MEIYIKNKKLKLHTKIFREKNSQTLRIKRICSTKNDFDHHSRELKGRLLKQVYDQELVDKQLEKVDNTCKRQVQQDRKMHSININI